MSAIGLFDVLGVADAGEAAGLWPLDYLPLDPASLGLMVAELAGALSFQNIRPGASDAAVGLSADMTVGAVPPTQPIVFAALPKFGFMLLETSAGPARLFVQQTQLGVELVIEAVPIEVLFPNGLLLPFDPAAGEVKQGRFDRAQPDSYEISLNASGPSTLKAYAKLRVSESFDFLLEFATPISVGPCRFSGIACAALHDLSLVLTPNPISMDARAQALEWLRHPLDTPHEAGGLAVRTVDLFSVGSRVATATNKANEGRPDAQYVEPVLEDILLIPTGPTSPFPLHFSAGVRRSLQVGESADGVYRLGDKPVVTALVEESAPGKQDGIYLIVRQVLLRSFANNTSLIDPQTAFLDIAISNDPHADGWSGTIDLSEDWTLSAGFHVEPPFNFFSLFNVRVKVLGGRIGVSFKRLFDPKPDAGVLDPYLALADLVIVIGDEAPSDPPAADTPVKVESKSGKPTTIVANGVGWKFGEKALGSFWQADKVDLKAMGVLRLSIDEFGYVTEPNGGRYFSFSGSWPVFGTPTATPETGTDYEGSFGVQFFRLRWRIHGDPNAPVFLIDGLGLFIQTGALSIIGSGMLSDRRVGQVRFREAAFGAELNLGLGKTADGKDKGRFTLGGQVLHGTATTYNEANTPVSEFTYWLAGMKVSPIPLPGGFSLVDLRGLFAWNMQPKLGPNEPSTAQPMRLFDWAQAHADAIEIKDSRNMAGAGWEPRENAWAFAAGAGVKLGGGNALTIDAFFLYVSSPAARGFLAALKLYLGGKKPIAYGVVELDGDHWSALVGLALGVEQATGKDLPSFFDAAPSLTGTFYATNQPATFAIGRLNDTSSWLALRIGGDLWVFRLKLFVGICLEIVDVPGGPRVLAFRAEFSGGTRKCAIGSIDFSLSMQLTVGVWRSESRVSGFVQKLEGSIRINVLYVFRFGASFKVEWTFLGPDPAYRQIGCEVRIHTPWWMPDKTFRWNRTLGEPQLESMETISPPLEEGAGHRVTAGDPIALPVSTLSDDPQAVLNISQLQALPAPALAGEAPLLPIDAVVALQFKPAVDDRLIWGQITPPDAGRQDSNKVSTRYALVELGIRRRPLAGGASAPWTTLLDPALSRTDDIASLPPATLAERRKSPLAMRWDADLQREQALDPRLLLLNSELPWRFMAVNLMGDENLVRTMPGWPCCPTFESSGEHVLNWEGQEAGARAPLTQLFSNSQTPWRWLVTPPLVVAPLNRPHLVPLPVIGSPEGEIARIRFDAPAARVVFQMAWKAMHLPRDLVITAFRGLKAVAEQAFPLSANSPDRIEIADAAGIEHLSVRITGRPVPDTAGVTGVVELEGVRYTTSQETLDALLHDLKCGSFDPATAGNGSRFAWLPNHEYEVQVKTRVQVAHETAGALVAEVPQILRFRTRGLLGLNGTDRVGSEIEPYVESCYPPRGTCLYRSEPALLAFDERFDILQRIDHPVGPNDPPERKQRVDWELVARLVGGEGDGRRLSATGADWIVAHRGTGSNLEPRPPVVGGTRGHVREALSLDPLRLRFEAVAANAEACGFPPPPTHRSRVLSHVPADPHGAPEAPALWPARSRVRIGLRVAGAPFVDRRTFEADDATAFTTAPVPWQSADGLLGPSATSGVQTAQFGQPDWLHFEAQLRLRALGTRAGLALAVTATGSLNIWLDETTLRIVRRNGAQEMELKSAAVGDGPALVLRVTAYDDEIVAEAGAAQLRTPRGASRGGRLALLAEGEAQFEALRVDGLDAYRFEYDVSRFEGFAEHVSSFSGRVRRIPAIGAAVGASTAELATRNAPFADWIAELGIPLQGEVERLDIGLHASGLLVIESPESFGGDVRLRLRQGGADVPATVVADTRGTVFLLAPASPISGDFELNFGISLTRYRAASADPENTLVQSHTLAISL
ncbi:hypothetical protein [Phenylobacterium sp.]|uniref:hypothetical protein n=1 Tax=Phenylobacterium sp. TaxID=1871053 RepID=UPI002EDA84DA